MKLEAALQLVRDYDDVIQTPEYCAAVEVLATGVESILARNLAFRAAIRRVIEAHETEMLSFDVPDPDRERERALAYNRAVANVRRRISRWRRDSGRTDLAFCAAELELDLVGTEGL